MWKDGSEEKYSYSIIRKRCEMHGIKISKCKMSNIINRKGKNRQSLLLHGKKTPNEYLKKILAKSRDVPPMDYSAFGLLKRALSMRKPTTIDGLWKVVEEGWK
ncbi:hypothetical protein AVEN_159950-1 [Araneus ventricosus]|uniref:Uncharacterized protein n=1 Tax=Araneus ventricosus TaxID=182803 RepID=A0A4Y2I2S1_ARAVE|nr:hypothetical protein AVEN_159950-1 [Araneus ventricosus]